MRRTRRKKSSIIGWHGGCWKQRILSILLCAALAVGTCIPQYGMSVYAADDLSSSAGVPISTEDSIEDNAELPSEPDYSATPSSDQASDTAMDKRLTVTMSKAEYEAGSELKPEDLTVEYRSADGEITVLPYQSDDSASGYTMSGVDTDTPGLRTLTVSYHDGTDTLTATVDYTVYGVLTDAMVTMPDWEYWYIREEHKPEPVVKYADDVVLKPEEDYSVSYADNIDAGEATVFISGKGVYRGTVTKKFTITKATFGEVNLSREESCWKATQGYWDLRGYFSVEADSDGGGFTGRSIGEIIEYNNVADGGGFVLSEMPYIDNGLLRYSTKAGTAGDSVLIPIIVSFGKNYNDARINITISLQDDGSAGGTYEGITWKVDTNGKLMVEGTGEFADSAAMNRAPWFYYADKIKSADIRVTGMQNAGYMFYGCSNLTNLDMRGFDMSSVTNMSHMFEGCESLTSLDLSDFDAGSVESADDMLSNCSSLSTIYTPCNVKVSMKLPAVGAADVWYDSENHTYTDMPLELDHSMILSKNEVPDMAMEKKLTVFMPKVDYEVGSVITSEDLTVKYRGTDGKTTVLHHKSDDSDSGYTMSGVDTDSPGVRTLAVSYHDGTDTLTEPQDYTVYGVLTDTMVTMPDQEYWYIGEEHKPEPVVKYADDVVLKPEEDYLISYADNINAGEATVSISGIGIYRGTVTKKFTIEKVTFGVVTLSWEESGWKAGTYSQDLSGYFSKEAVDGGGITSRSIGEIIEYNNVAGGEGNVLSKQPTIDASGILRYSTNVGAAGDSVLIPIILTFGRNYNDAVINVTISLKDEDSVSGTYEGITWKIDDAGKLTVEGTGEFANDVAVHRAPWYDYRDKIESAEICVTGMQNASWMFHGCDKLTSIDMSGFDTSSVTNMRSMFRDCSSLTSLDLGSFDTSNVTDMWSMFRDCSSLTSLDLSSFDTGSVTDMGDMFFGCSNLTSVDVSGFNTSKVTDMNSMFRACKSLTDLDLSSFDTGNVTNMRWMFAECNVLKSLDVSSFDTGSVTNMSSMFDLCENLTNLDLSGFYTGNVTDMTEMFWGCRRLTSLDLSSFHTGKVTNMYEMFEGCRSLTSLDLSSFDMSSVITMEKMFESCTSLSTLYTPYNILIDTAPALPAKDDDKWYDLEQNTYTELPAGLDYSIVLAKNKTPDATEKRLKVILLKYAYEKGSVIQPEDLTVQYRGTDGKTILVPVKDDQNVSGYTMSGADTDTLGKKTLTVSYNDGTDELTAKAAFKVVKIKVVISADRKESIPYNGSPVSPESAVVVRTANGSETDVTKLVTILRHYTGTQNDGTIYDSNTAPIHAGHYAMTLTVRENDDYEGSTKILFQISKAPLTITARDISLVIGKFYALPEESLLKYDVKGLCGTHTARDVMSVMPTVAYGLNGTVINREEIAIDREGSYELILSGAELNMTAGFDYVIQTYKNGTLVISKTASENPSDPSDPDDSGFPDDGKFRISKVPDQIYTGKAIKPAVIVYYGSRRLTEKTDYTVAYKNNINANDAKVEKTAPTITVKGKGNYSGKQSITFVIKPKSIEGDDVTALEIAAAKNGKVQRPVPNLVINENNKNKKLKDKKDFIVSYPDENQAGAYQEAGTYTVTVTGTGNYTGSRNINFTITDKTLLSKAKITVKAKDYTGSAVTLGAEDITVKVGKVTLTYGTDYTLSYRNNTQAGKATVIVTGAGDAYAGSKEAVFKINGVPLAKAQISGISERTYTGAAVTQNIQVQLNGKTLNEGSDYTVSYAKAVNAGQAAVIISGTGGYTGTVRKTFPITPYDLQTDEAHKLDGVPVNPKVAYTKGGATPELALTFDGKALTVKKDYTVTYKNNKKPGEAAGDKAPVMIVKGKGNFKGTLTIPFAITVNSLETDNTVTITAADTAYVNKAGKYAVKPVLIDVNGKKLAAGTDYEKTFTYTLLHADGSETELTTADIVPAGSSVKVTVKGKGSYTGSISATYRITQAPFSKAKITINPKVYTGGQITLNEEDIQVTLGGKGLIYGEDYTVVEGSYKNNVKKGRATVTVKGLNNYGGSKNVKFKITTRTITKFLFFDLFKK